MEEIHMSNASDFIIENGVLIKYKGEEGLLQREGWRVQKYVYSHLYMTALCKLYFFENARE